MFGHDDGGRWLRCECNVWWIPLEHLWCSGVCGRCDVKTHDALPTKTMAIRAFVAMHNRDPWCVQLKAEAERLEESTKHKDAQRLDGGPLDLGLVRDGKLNTAEDVEECAAKFEEVCEPLVDSRNRFTYFVETWFGLPPSDFKCKIELPKVKDDEHEG